jgi:hypothetical protein
MVHHESPRDLTTGCGAAAARWRRATTMAIAAVATTLAQPAAAQKVEER